MENFLLLRIMKKKFDDEFERQPIKIYTPVQTSVRLTDVSGDLCA